MSELETRLEKVRHFQMFLKCHRSTSHTNTQAHKRRRGITCRWTVAAKSAVGVGGWSFFFSPDGEQEVPAGAASPSYCPASERTALRSASPCRPIFPVACSRCKNLQFQIYSSDRRQSHAAFLFPDDTE